MTRSVLAIDGGGTKTAGLVADEHGNVTRLKSSTGCNPHDDGDWKAGLGAVLRQVSIVDFAVVGMPGFGEIPKFDAIVVDHIQSILGANHVIINDVELAFRGAFPASDGVLVLAGTGSMAVGSVNGVVKRSGGWGNLIGDEGSGYWIGQQALVLATAELDGRAPRTGFAAKLKLALDVPKHEFGLLDWAMQGESSRARIASVAAKVDELSQSGDAVAHSILDAAAQHLITLAQAFSSNTPNWAHAGSVFQSTQILDSLTKTLGPPTPLFTSALGGGLCHAASLANWNVSSDWIEKIKSQS